MEMFSTYIVPVIVGICLIVGYLIKHTTGGDHPLRPAYRG